VLHDERAVLRVRARRTASSPRTSTGTWASSSAAFHQSCGVPRALADGAGVAGVAAVAGAQATRTTQRSPVTGLA